MNLIGIIVRTIRKFNKGTAQTPRNLLISIFKAEASNAFERIRQDLMLLTGSKRKESGSLVMSNTGRFFNLGSWLRLSTKPFPSMMGI